jgi:hypothetical protein
MVRFLVVGPLLFAVSVFTFAQTPTISKLSAVALASKSLAALSGGATVSDVTLTGNATWIAGSDRETGPATFYAKGNGTSRVDLNLSGGDRNELRVNVGGVPHGKWKKHGAKAADAAQHNAWTDAVWFFPALSSLTQVSNPNYVFSYVGQEQRNGMTVQHLHVSQALPSDVKNISRVPQMSAMDFYLDPASLLPLSVTFNVHPDKDMNTNIPVEIRFADYRTINGVRVPYHIQRLLNGGLALDIVVANAVINSGLSATQFTLQ